MYQEGKSYWFSQAKLPEPEARIRSKDRSEKRFDGTVGEMFSKNYAVVAGERFSATCPHFSTHVHTDEPLRS